MGTLQWQMLVMTFEVEHLLLWNVVCITVKSLFREFQWVILVSSSFSFLEVCEQVAENVRIKGALKTGQTHDFRAPLVNSSSSSWSYLQQRSRRLLNFARHGGTGFLRTVRHSLLLPVIEVRDATFYFTSSMCDEISIKHYKEIGAISHPDFDSKATKRQYSTSFLCLWVKLRVASAPHFLEVQSNIASTPHKVLHGHNPLARSYYNLRQDPPSL